MDPKKIEVIRPINKDSSLSTNENRLFTGQAGRALHKEIVRLHGIPISIISD